MNKKTTKQYFIISITLLIIFTIVSISISQEISKKKQLQLDMI
jgi:hypothetical protein